jgi:hypothetical protein
MDNNNQDNVKSNVLKLESLEKEFSLVMAQYKQAYASYVQELNHSSTSLKDGYVTKPGYIYWAQPILKNQKVENENECAALCSADPKCKAASYFKDKSICATSGGNASPTLSDSNTTTIYVNAKLHQMYLNQCQELNERLVSLHGEIMNVLQSTEPSYKKKVEDIEVQGTNLNQIYSNLQEERKKIDRLLAEYQTLDQIQADSSLEVDSNYSYYRILFIIALIVLFFVVKQLLTSGNGGATSSSAEIFG